MPNPPVTVIVRSRKENPRKCTIVPLKGRDGLLIVTHPAKRVLPLEGYIRLSADGPALSADDTAAGILLLDGSWRRADAMETAYAQVPPRSLQGWKTAYPRVSSLGTDPDNGLATVEALFLAYHLLGRPTAGLLDHYHWAREFLAINGLA